MTWLEIPPKLLRATDQKYLCALIVGNPALEMFNFNRAEPFLSNKLRISDFVGTQSQASIFSSLGLRKLPEYHIKRDLGMRMHEERL